MSKPKVMILRTAGTNCDEETAHAWELAGAETRRVHVRELADHPDRLRDYAILTIPGGFSYGDDISAGKILANQMVHHLADTLRDFVAAGKLILGICNGFQVLVKAGLLPGSLPGRAANQANSQTVTLTQNDSARFECRWVSLAVDPESPCVFTRGLTRLDLPVRHGEGKLVAAPETWERIRAAHQAPIAYVDPATGAATTEYPANPNGSPYGVAALTDPTGRLFGLMPHPEAFLHGTNHPRWTREPRPEEGDGLALFRNAVEFIRRG